MIHALYVWFGPLAGFVVGCWWAGRGMAQLLTRCEWAENCIRILDEERRKPRRIYRSRSTLLTDEESDVLWESIMGGPPVDQ